MRSLMSLVRSQTTKKVLYLIAEHSMYANVYTLSLRICFVCK